MGLHIRKNGGKSHKSKRLTGREKAKIREFGRNKQRQIRAEQRKRDRMGLARRFRNDPGIPNEHPLKNEILEEARMMKERAEEERKRQREARQRIFNRQRNIEAKAEKHKRQADEANGLVEDEEEQYDVLRDSVFDEAKLVPTNVVQQVKAQQEAEEAAAAAAAAAAEQEEAAKAAKSAKKAKTAAPKASAKVAQGKVSAGKDGKTKKNTKAAARSQEDNDDD